MKNKRGITLIALIITIVVLLILAGVSMNAIVGENGIIRNAQKSKVEAEKAQFIEEAQIVYVESGGIENKESSSIVLERIKEVLDEKNEYKGKIKKVKNDGLTEFNLKDKIELRLKETKEIEIEHYGENRILCRFIWKIL